MLNVSRPTLHTSLAVQCSFRHHDATPSQQVADHTVVILARSRGEAPTDSTART